MVRTLDFHCQEPRFNPWWGTKTPKATWCGKKKKKKPMTCIIHVIFNIISEIMCIAFYKTLSMRN